MRLNNELMPHQQAGVEKLSHYKVGALFMEQGTGKTITALELCRRRIESGKVNKILWLCPCSAKDNIKNEILKQAPPDMLPYIIVCGIESFSKSVRLNVYIRNLVNQVQCFLVVDESLLIKNPFAIRTKNIQVISEKCPYRLILNGTPISRNEADLYSQFYLLDWRILGYRSYSSFAANHLEYDPKIPGRVIRCHNIPYLMQKIEPYTYQVEKKDCIKLPPKKHLSDYVYLTPDQDAHYADVSMQLLSELDEERPETLYRLFSACQAIACGRRVDFVPDSHGYRHMQTKPFFDDPAENPRLEKLLELLNPEQKQLIYCTYTSDIHAICHIINERYGAGSAVPFDGKVPMRQRMSNVEAFEKQDKTRFMVGNRNCAGYSLNLQFCHNIIYYANDWNLATRLQSEDRTHRIGQKHQVDITDIFAYDTIDERIIDSLWRKENLLDRIRSELSIHAKSAHDVASEVVMRKGRERIQTTIYDCSDLEVS